MKRFSTPIGTVICPRCKTAKLIVRIEGLIMKSGALRSVAKVTEGDSNPACMLEERKAVMTPEDAGAMLDKAILNQAAENSAPSVHDNG